MVKISTLSLAVRKRGSSLKASFTSLLNLLKSVSNSSTYFSESCGNGTKGIHHSVRISTSLNLT